MNSLGWMTLMLKFIWSKKIADKFSKYSSKHSICDELFGPHNTTMKSVCAIIVPTLQTKKLRQTAVRNRTFKSKGSCNELLGFMS